MPKQLAKVVLAGLLVTGTGYQAAYAQQSAGTSVTAGTCTGTVTDATGEPVIGASVFVLGTSKGATTNIDGQFSLSGIANGATLRITCIGFQAKEVTWTGSALNVVLSEDDNLLDEVVVVGYGTQKKVNLTGAVATVSGDVLKDRPITNIGTTVRDSVLKPAFISSNFAVKIGLWTKWNFTGKFFNPSRPYAREANNQVRFLPTVGITELSKIKCVRY